MQTAQDITSCLKNIRYYSEKIAALSKQQLELDWTQGEQEGKVGKYSMPNSIRFESLACIASACEWLDIYCSNIEANLRTAENQDKVFAKEVSDGI